MINWHITFYVVVFAGVVVIAAAAPAAVNKGTYMPPTIYRITTDDLLSFLY